jgi:hypothetical protein
VVGEPGVGIDGIELCGLDQGLGDGSGLAACLGADEEVVLSPVNAGGKSGHVPVQES